MDCPNSDANFSFCNCTYEPCARKGRCCECVRYHISMKQLPACAFSTDAERTYDRSFAKFVEENS
ncbi:MAG: hypothetical protein CVT63_07720 [Candidatus Anoxymicrobium japonicum]|uniref:Cytosolic protein n=1 Tax=Candidatus Anoxymicrobium japonicum TaxID=2013648 RepID=A0A2N3G435_9ACTN|nr:MAG: hypothetical protein CVT63_07720 [Candidatus Anoxymicrobium japonicum]